MQQRYGAVQKAVYGEMSKEDQLAAMSDDDLRAAILKLKMHLAALGPSAAASSSLLEAVGGREAAPLARAAAVRAAKSRKLSQRSEFIRVPEFAKFIRKALTASIPYLCVDGLFYEVFCKYI